MIILEYYLFNRISIDMYFNIYRYFQLVIYLVFVCITNGISQFTPLDSILGKFEMEQIGLSIDMSNSGHILAVSSNGSLISNILQLIFTLWMRKKTLLS